MKRTKPPFNGEYWQVQQVDCLECGKADVVKEGYYIFDTPIECECGNRITFNMNCRVSKQSPIELELTTK